MRKIIASLLLTLAASLGLSAQNTLTQTEQSVKYPFSIYKKIHDPAIQQKMISVLVRGDVGRIKEEIENLGGVFKYASGDIACIRIPVNRIGELATQKFISRIEGGQGKLQVLNDQMVLNNNVTIVHQGFNLPQGYDGQGVVVGVIDEGIDINHKDLRDVQGHTRIKWLWDQRLSTDPKYTPQEYGYGQSFTAAQIDNQEAGDVMDYDYSHGTAVTGTAAGNGNAVNNYQGVAPKADIIFVAVSTSGTSDNGTDLRDAVEYIFNRADSLGEPCVINISLGDYYGSHDAKDLQALSIEDLLTKKNGRFIACAAGNAGAAPIHLQTYVTPDSSFTWMGKDSTLDQLYFELCADTADLKNVEWMVGVDKKSPAYEYRGGLPFKFATSHFGYAIASVFAGGNRIGQVETYLDSAHGSYTLECLITPDSMNYRWRFMTRGTGKFDLWSFDLIPADLPDSATYPIIVKYKTPDWNQSIVGSFSCSSKIITVGSYVNRNGFTNVNGNWSNDSTLIVGKLSNFSSRGPTRDGRIKPEIAATGEWILSSAAQNDLIGTIACCPQAIAAGGQHRNCSGTSFASPVVAGIAALYLQKNPTASYQQVLDAITTCTKTDQFTGNALPDNSWGYGKVDAYKVMKGCVTGVSEADNSNIYFENNPNPFSDQTVIHYNLTNYTKHASGIVIILSDAYGRKVRELALDGLAGDFVMNKNGMGSGVYFCSLLLDGKIIRTNKLVVL